MLLAPFSAHILLRVGAMEGHWPTGLLDVGPGFVTPLVLILSSVTVVMAWASLKLNNFQEVQIVSGNHRCVCSAFRRHQVFRIQLEVHASRCDPQRWYAGGWPLGGRDR